MYGYFSFKNYHELIITDGKLELQPNIIRLARVLTERQKLAAYAEIH